MCHLLYMFQTNLLSYHRKTVSIGYKQLNVFRTQNQEHCFSRLTTFRKMQHCLPQRSRTRRVTNRILDFGVSLHCMQLDSK